MATIDEFVKVGFTISKATSLAIFFSNVGYLCTAKTDDFVDGFKLPDDKIIRLSNIDSLKTVFKSDTQYYKDIETIFIQKGNLKPNQSGVNQVIVYVGTLQESEDYGNLVDEFISVNANYARLTIDSRKPSDILAASKKAQANDRRFIAQTKDETLSGKTPDNIASQMNKLNLDLIDLDFYNDDTSSLACADMSVATQELLGSVGDLYSQFTNVATEEYTSTIEGNLKDLNVSYYTTVNAINGGGVDAYAQKLFLGGYTITGEDRKRRDIRYYFDKIMKARSLDFLAKKLAYQDSSANILLAMLNAILVEGQRNNLIIQDSTVQDGDNTITTKGFEIKAIYPSVLRNTEPTAYEAKRYKIVGYYRDALTGREVEISLYVDPKDYEIALAMGEA